MTMTTPDLMSDCTLRSIERAAAVVFLIMLGVTFVYWPRVEIVGGIVAGALIGFLNFRLIRRGVRRMMGEGGPQKKGFGFFIKLLFLTFVIGFLMVKTPINPVAFVAGFSVIVLGIGYQGIKSIF